jgi:hypothetical protein
MLSDAKTEPDNWDLVSADCTISVASSDRLPVRDKSVDFVLCSPPYCTRIDYGVATSPELAVLGFSLAKQLPALRRELIGTPTIQEVVPQVDSDWGPTCNSLLKKLYEHPSKAAKSYYYKTYVQYFAGIARSFGELSRCMKTGATCLMVVQDSYFKNLRVDLGSIFDEIGCGNGLTLSRQVDFAISRTFASINTGARRYRNERSATESILCFTRN